MLSSLKRVGARLAPKECRKRVPAKVATATPTNKRSDDLADTTWPQLYQRELRIALSTEQLL
jgi:hypothetical protein